MWREHYRKIFPTFVFYFEGIQDDVRRNTVRQVRSLGSRDEKFFSRTVTHVITTRDIPKAKDLGTTDARVTPNEESQGQDASVKTINPVLLKPGNSSRKNLFDDALHKKANAQGQPMPTDVDTRRQQSGQGDILSRARDMGMKIWALEKLERMLETLFAGNENERPSNHNLRGTRITAVPSRGVVSREADLSQLLKKEKIQGPADRDLTVATQEMVPLRGCYVYVHDMLGQTRPVMVRDYAVPTVKEDGKWPQFRNTGPGKCPFIEDPNHVRKQQLQQRVQAKTETTAPRTRATSNIGVSKSMALGNVDGARALTERNSNLPLRQMTVDSMEEDSLNKPLEPPKVIPAKRSNTDDLPPMYTSAQANRRPLPTFAGGQPIASGMQPSNITSAIRSNYISSISSTAPVPGASRAGSSKEINQLKRKVFERTSAPSANSAGSYANDVRAAINDDRAVPSRAAKRKAQENLAGIIEEESACGRGQAPRRAALQRKRSADRDPKPGYCENCREKFDDFEVHVATSKHQKFGRVKENWRELDDLLSQLVRPMLKR
ncbi:hypothetical protein EJ05DRAFT_279488 [Pseudovirgaria hyperparasitica]|uniref:DBF4-type domain-containing protein n=1 Tax=Pseudovirgaria hyperparasitica TaxID=470096 RepID=A0A6A6WCL7_9PEZI|nr:uncharacterized protein EJ05DRAFT_279488 [Pseudovirgaria hyperparasitica]KAF2760315.1 hypothetical protein EJ05DRAFT_279488 [Pseudovirgaria hyperparasitica]